MWKITWRGLRSHWLRFVMTVLAIVLGIAFLVGSFVITDTIRVAFDDLFAKTTQGTDAIVRNKATVKSDFGEQRPPVSASIIPTIKAVPGVRTAEGFIQIENVRMIDRHGDEVGGFAPQFGYTWGKDSGLSPWRLAEGRPPRTSDEVVIDRGSALQEHFHVGDRVKILSRLPARTYRIVGITRFGRVDRPLGSTAALFTTAQAQRIADLEGQFADIGVAAEPGVSQSVLQARLKRVINTPGTEVLTGAQYRAEQQNDVRESLKFLNVALGVFAAIGLLVGAFIIFNTFSIVLAQRTRELALLRAVGSSPAQVFRSVLTESMLVGVIASGLGVVGGVLLAAAIRALLDGFGLSLPGGAVVLEPRTVVLGLVTGVSVTMIAAMMPAWKAGHIPPIAALRSAALEQRVDLTRRIVTGVTVVVLGVTALLLGLFVISNDTTIWLFVNVGAKVAAVGVGAVGVFVGVVIAGPALVRPVARFVGAPLPRLRGMAGQLARENAIRSPRRSSRTAIALTLGVALVGFITIFGASAKASISKLFGSQLNADYLVTAGSGFGGSPMSPDVASRIGALPEVDAVSGLRFDGAKVIDPTSGKPTQRQVTAMDEDALARILDAGEVTGNLSQLGDGLGLSRKLADKLKVGIGDSLAMQIGQETAPTRFPVRAIYEKTELAGPILMSIDTFERHSRLNIDYVVIVITNPDVTPTQMRVAMKPILAEYPNIKLQDRQEFVEAQAKQVDQVVAFIYVLLFLSIVIALIGIANTMALSIHERTHEIGLLRAVGMSRRQVRVSVRWEAVIIAIFGTAIGLVIGLFFGWAIIQSLHDQGFTELDIAAKQLVLVVFIAAFAGVIAALVPAWRAARLNVLDAIRSE